ncbi:MAG: FliH/SctL family protein [Planctomycetia bacterium]|nr:FliH/SctL family protein [Planctomycetia bacterium]
MKDEQESRREDAKPFAFSSLENRTQDYLARIRGEADRIAKQTKEEIHRLKEQTENELQASRRSLDHLQKDLENREKDLVNRERNLRQLEEEIRKETVEKNRQAGFEEGRQEGISAGYQSGLDQAKKEYEEKVRHEFEDRVHSLVEQQVPLLDGMVKELLDIRQSLLKCWENNILQVAAALAYQTIGKNLPSLPNVPLELLREALELSLGCTLLKVRMNPQDLETLKDPINDLLREVGILSHTELEGDPKITPGGCVVETGQGLIDQQLDVRLDRIISELE